MSYIALYRKFRPNRFDEVIGQDHIVTTLKNQIKANRIGHAYLFCGTRGTGKTTIARILAKAVNCEQPIDGNPCNTCAICEGISAQTSMNVIEIDAASNNGIDHIREIIEEVRYSPTSGKYKVYIIDEVHMLSQGAFNALLKTLEEPPSYVIFILATTEVHKIPITILSRCQRYDYRRISIDNITKCLRELMKLEQIETEEKALRFLAKTADGSMRDAISLLEQCIAFYLGQNLTYDKVLEVLGSVEVEAFANLLRFIRKGSVEACITLLEEVVTAGKDLIQFTIDFTWYLRNLLLIQAAEDRAEFLEVSKEQLELLQHEAAVCESELLIRYIRIFSDLSNQIRYSVQKRVLVEVAFIKLCKPMMEVDISSLLHRVKCLEEQLENGILPVSVQKQERVQAEPEELPVTEPVVPEDAVPEDLQLIASNWKQIMARVSPLLRNILLHVVPTPGALGKLELLFSDELDKKAAEQPTRLEDLKNAIQKATGKRVEIEMKLLKKEEGSASKFCDLTKLIRKPIPIEYVDE